MLRQLALLVGGAVVVALAVPRAAGLLGGPLPTRVDALIAEVAAVVVVVGAAWYAVAALLAVLATALRAVTGWQHGRSRRGRQALTRLAAGLEALLRRYGPPLLRRGASLGLGLGLTVNAVPGLATATATAATSAPVAHTVTAEELPTDLRPGAPATPAPVTEPATRVEPDTADDDGASTADPTAAPEPTSPATHPAPETARESGPTTVPGSTGEPPAGPAETGTTEYTVRPGDSLWRIAAAQLGPGAEDAQIARAWRDWHVTNAALIGPDPNLIHPGQVLLAPSKEDTT